FHVACLTLVFCRVSLFDASAPSEIYPLSLHDALPISSLDRRFPHRRPGLIRAPRLRRHRRWGVRWCHHHHHHHHHHHQLRRRWQDRKSTRLNSSHVKISYAVFCLKKKKTK